MKNSIYISIICLIILSCKKEKEDIPPVPLALRIENNSKYNFDDVFVNTSGGQNNFGTIKAGKTSQYKKFTLLHRYAYMELSINGQEFRYQPYDYFGEKEHTKGKYTYIIDVTDFTNKRLSIDFKED